MILKIAKGYFWALFGPCSPVLVEKQFLTQIGIHHVFTIISLIHCAKIEKNLIIDSCEKPKIVTDQPKDERVSSHPSQYLLVQCQR